MKTSLFTTLSFLLFSTKLLLARSASNEPVIDIYGNKVKYNHNYYVVTEAPYGVLGLFLGVNDNHCPLGVVRKTDPTNETIINFFPDDGSNIVRESTDLNVKFLYENGYCHERKPPIWKVSNYAAGDWFIVASGALVVGDWFKIEKVSNTSGVPVYKFVHCTSVCEGCEKLCYNLGSTFKVRAWRLVLDPDELSALHFVLIPAPENYQLIMSN